MSLTNQQYLRYSKPSLTVFQTGEGINTPLSFKEWIDLYKGVIPGEEYRQYNGYLVQWYNDNSAKAATKLSELQLNFLFLLKQLQVFFEKQDLENWYANIDITSEKEILLAIPYFAKKLKEISLYYLKLRTEIKDNQIRYKLVGTPSSLSQELQNLLLTDYTKKPDAIQAIPAQIWKNVPELSSITEPIVIQIEELYDTFNYMDHSNTVPVSTYYNLNDATTNDFFETLGLDLIKDSWVFETGSFSNILSSQIVDNINLSDRILQKYLGTDKYSITPVITSNNSQIFNLSLTRGNNTFYWPGEAYKTKLTELPFFDPQPLSSAKIEDIGTSGQTIDNADTVFIKTVNGIKGAWLRKETFTEKPATMKALLRKLSKTQFRYPYPGYGLSGDDIPWTGFGLESDRRFYFLDDPFKNAINRVYWSTSLGLTGVTPIPLNSTTLVDVGAYADIDYDTADKIRIWLQPPRYNSNVYTGKINEAWLYRMNNTDISIAQASDSTVVWPFQKINPRQAYPKYLPENLDNCCLPIPLSSINFPFSVASDNLSSADSVYIIQNFKDNKSIATDCAWLSGRYVYYPETKLQAVLQPGLTINAQPGTFTKFIWHGPDNFSCNTVFASYDHQPDCKYVTEKATYKNINLCTCKQVLFTPFGHPGANYNRNQRLADFIIEDINPNIPFELTTWRDNRRRPFNRSDDFGWFKTNRAIGWGSGQWINGRGEPFLLQQGKSYIYYRADSRALDTTVTPFSGYILRYSYNNFTPENFKWIRGQKTSNNSWVNTTSQSPIIIESGDNFIYSRQATTSYTLTGLVTRNQTIAENRGSIWSSVDYATIGQSVTITFPLVPAPFQPSSFDQYPELDTSNFLNVFEWAIRAPNGKIRKYKNTPGITFTLDLLGEYSISAIAISATLIPPALLGSVQSTTTTITVSTETVDVGNQKVTTITTKAPPVQTTSTFAAGTTGFYYFSKIPPITAVPTQIQVPSLTSFKTPVPGFVLNTPLYGWNYNTNSPVESIQNSNQGGRPIWVKSSFTETSASVNFSRIDTLGSSIRLVDTHNLLSQPEPTEIVLRSGMFFEYERNNNFDVNWVQPIVQEISATQNTWCEIIYDEDDNYNLKNIIKGDTLSKVVIPTKRKSNLMLQTYVDNEPVEVFYNAKNPFVWSISAQPTVLKTTYSDISTTTTVDVLDPSQNLSNRYYPTIATLPTLQALSSQSDMGGYFIPSNLGVLQYHNQGYSTTAITSAINYNKVYENPNEYISGVGSTKQEQQTFYEITKEDNTWLKEPPITGAIAGTIKKDIFKKHPKFIPYQSINETNKLQRLGIITSESLLTPWTGPQDTDWGDSNNRPISFTGQINVERWANSQLLKRTNLQLENWCTDIYNNQYGLYKETKEVPITEKRKIPGELWVRKNSQKVYPAVQGLSGVIDTYLNVSLLNDLTGQGIYNIETFFDTLYIQTSSAVIFERIIYDYNTDDIFSLADDARFLSLLLPIQTNLDREFNLSAFETANIFIEPQLQIGTLNDIPIPLSSEAIKNLSAIQGYVNDSWILFDINNELSTTNIAYNFYNIPSTPIYAKPGDIWFFPAQKQVIQTICALSGYRILPELYSYSINDLSLKKVFPLKQDDINLITELTSLQLSNFDAPIITYSPNLEQFVYTINTQNISGDNIHIDFKINNSVNQLNLDSINVYTPNKIDVVEDPPVLLQDLHISLQFSVPFQLQLSPLYGPVTYTTIDWPFWARLSPTGFLEGRAQGPGFYTLPFYVTNNIGSTYYCITVYVSDVIDTSNRILGGQSTSDFFSVSSITTDQEINGFVSWIVTD